MKVSFVYISLIMSLLAIVGLSSCNRSISDTEQLSDTAAETQAVVPSDTASESVSPFDGEPLPESDYSKNYDEIAAHEAELAQQTKTPSSNTKATTGRTEKLYISTYGAQDQVWGYVTMRGNSGRGTIHDADENTLSITVTRHGNELFGTDQNGREYVFKI